MKNTFSYENKELENSRIKLGETVSERFGERQPLCFLHSFGCQQNVSDGEKIMMMLSTVGFGFTNDTDEADLIIYNTCAVRENAEDRVFGAVGNLKHLKEQKPDVVIGICGCMAQQKSVCEKIKSTYKQVDLVFGTFAYNDLFVMLEEIYSKHTKVFNIEENTGIICEELKQLRSDKVKATVPILYGCNNFCTYCIVPYVRGRERSRSIETVVNEVKVLVNEGYKEITLLGQNVNSYEYGFPELLREVDKIDGHFRIRFMSPHPKDATNELIDTIINSKHICKQLHLPLQAGNDRILKLMNRKYSVSDYMKIVEYARSKSPDFCISTDIIVGFPGESYEEFCDTKKVIKEVGYYNIFSFVYSKRKGTKAAEMEDGISDKQKGLWLRELLLEQRETAMEINNKFVGRIKEVLVDGKSSTNDKLFNGKTDEGIIVEFEGDESLIGEFVNVKIMKAMNWALHGEIAE
ncbi:MAG: tRNA (N6-isopentenyl adenosine(37)-C2)-methylthiotransferase MiaB [Oscillospiraceae bacterium]|nr:tRNA (N6-isopentenyl adenosine(37)-C2)-methylthiotransferase MiaB [Oscillospiraceae bacterium]